MTEYKFTLDKSPLKAGAYTLHAVNAGQQPHVLELSGPGVIDEKTAILQPGQSDDIVVTLEAGTYDIRSPLDGDRGKGMEMRVGVTV